MALRLKTGLQGQRTDCYNEIFYKMVLALNSFSPTGISFHKFPKHISEYRLKDVENLTPITLNRIEILATPQRNVSIAVTKIVFYHIRASRIQLAA